MGTLYKKYIKNKIFNKMLLVYSSITILSIVLLTKIFINYYIDNEFKNELAIHSEVIFNIEKRLEEQENISKSVINGINTQSKIIDEIQILTNSTFEQYLSYKLDKYSLTNIKQIDLDYLIDTILSDRDDVLAIVINDEDKEYKHEIVLDHNKWFDIKNSKSKNIYMRKISKPINEIGTIRPLGYIDIYFNLNTLDYLLKNLDGNIMIFDEDDNVVFRSNEELNITNFNDLVSNRYKNKYLNKSRIEIKEDAQTQYKYVSIIDSKDIEINNIICNITLISFICITIILSITYMVINSYSYKLKYMINSITKIKNGDLSTRFNLKELDDELDMIADSIDQMTESLQYNIDKNYIAEVKQKEAEISALQAQINPHFLFNTLEVIRMCALASKNKEVSQMIYNLASMFRYSTYNNGSLVKLSDELKHSDMYLSLCSTRYKSIMNYTLDIDEKYLDCLVPKFTLQPILENSINYGLKKDSFDNFIKVSINEFEECIELIIEDNGFGMTKEQLEEIEKGLQKNIQKPSSIGLMNINSRIKLKFGNSYGISIDSEINKGTIVKVKIPTLREGVGHV